MSVRNEVAVTTQMLGCRRRGLFHPQHFALVIHHHLETHHPKIGARVFRDALLQQHVELLVHVFELLLDGCYGKEIVLAKHLGSLFRDQVLAAFHQFCKCCSTWRSTCSDET
jgi:hypothetical protein